MKKEKIQEQFSKLQKFVTYNENISEKDNLLRLNFIKNTLTSGLKTIKTK